MSVGSVTARSGGGLMARRYLPRSVARAMPGIARTVGSRAALARLAVALVRPTSPLPVALLIGAWMLYNRRVAPPGFPGFDNVDQKWTSNNGIPYPAAELGDYSINGFDKTNNWSPTAPNLIDENDGTPIDGFRYWGHYGDGGALPPLPATNWPQVPTFLPPAARRIRYRTLPNLVIGIDDLVIDDGLADNVVITIALPMAGAQARTGFFPGGVTIGKNEPRRKQRDTKVKPKNMLVFLIMKRIANLGGEAKEWIDILAEAADYNGWKARRRAGFLRPGPRTQEFGGPQHTRRPGETIRSEVVRERVTTIDIDQVPASIDDGGHETQLKAFYLFQLAGVNSIDTDLFMELVRENQVEDAIFGGMGEASKFASRRLGMTVGFQTGLVM